MVAGWTPAIGRRRADCRGAGWEPSGPAAATGAGLGPQDERLEVLAPVLGDVVVGQPPDLLGAEAGLQQRRPGLVRQQPGALHLGRLGLRMLGLPGAPPLLRLERPGRPP